MRPVLLLSFLLLAQLGSALSVGGQSPPAATDRPLILIPTMVQELRELRMNTGERAIARDGAMNAVYVMKTPTEGNTYLNFHVDAASEGGPFVLHANGIRLEGPAVPGSDTRVDIATGERIAGEPSIPTYIPFDWFLDTGVEVRGNPLTINDKAIVQFTIEVPRAGYDDLVLFVHSERIGTVREIRDGIAAGSRVQ